MKREAAVIGYSGHSYVVIDALLDNNYVVKTYCESDYKSNNPYLLEYLGNESNPEVILQLKKFDVFLGVGDNKIRAKIFNCMTQSGINCPYIIHSKGYVSSLTEIGLGTIIMPGVIVNSMSIIGKAVICNSASIIEHECRIGDFVHIAPGAVLAGNVVIGEQTFIGAGAVIKQGITIGSDVIIGAGAVVTKDIADKSLVYGNPARIR